VPNEGWWKGGREGGGGKTMNISKGKRLLMGRIGVIEEET